ncbi:MAG: radical SAM protein [Acidobacteriota bacterium]
MKYNRVDRLVIKPTLGCTANCAGCVSRRELHRSLSSDQLLSLKQWKTILRDAASLGLKNLHISGGEPTLYPELTGLIEEGKQLGLRVRINSNGSMITEAFAEDLLSAGLDEICISLYSHQPEVHNSFRGSLNLWEKATRAVQIFSELRSRYPRFFLGTMSIILRENYQSLDRLMAFHHELGSQQIGLSYLECDFSGKYLLNRDEILEFRQTVVPKLVEYCRSLDSRIRNRAINVVQGLYGTAAGHLDDLSRGLYWHKNYCDVPKTAGLIMANGDVHPCNIVEYTHEPVMGNLAESSFREIWFSENWNHYRKTLHQKCSFCPVNIYTPVPLEYTPGSSLAVSLYHSRAFKPLRPAAEKLRDFCREQKHRF